jgi:hypothetical protein
MAKEKIKKIYCKCGRVHKIGINLHLYFKETD